ncbi:MAG TPA: TIGR03899 family protein, partial [Pseudoalteromonas sp.]|nr:TIGR03899 family protein [Pseudoalteromonas sp.]
MTVKSAQARINLANIIESLLGYPVKKITTNTGQPSTDQSYGSKGDLNPL